MCFISLSLHIVWACVHQSFLRSHEHLIGGHVRTAIHAIVRSRCHVEEAIFREVVSSGEAQQTLRETH